MGITYLAYNVGGLLDLKFQSFEFPTFSKPYYMVISYQLHVKGICNFIIVDSVAQMVLHKL